MRFKFFTTQFLLVLLPLFSIAQVNPLLKKYAGTYYRLSHSEKQPTGFSEKVVLAADGKLTSTYFPYEDEGVARIAQKRSGTWKPSEAGLKISITGIDPGTKESFTIEEEYKLVEAEYRILEGNFYGDNNKLVKIIVSNPAFVIKYAGNYNWVDNSRDVSDYTPTLTLKTDGTCSMKSLNTEPVTGTWKAVDGIIQLLLKEKEGEQMTEFNIKNGVFTDRQDYELKKVIPPPPPGLYLGKYAGSYSLLVEGKSTSNKYVLKPDGTGTWSFYTQLDAQGTLSKTPTVVTGTWKASEGLIQLYFQPEGSGGDHGDELISDYRLQDGLFKAEEGLSLKKMVSPAVPKK